MTLIYFFDALLDAKGGTPTSKSRLLVLIELNQMLNDVIYREQENPKNLNTFYN